MTQEEAERRATREEDRVDAVDAHNNLHHHHIPPPPESLDGAAYDTGTTQRADAVEETMAKAQQATDKQTSEKGRRRSEEEDVPDRTLLTYEQEGRHSTTLPVVQETGEGSSSISARSGSDAANTNDTEVMDADPPEMLAEKDGSQHEPRRDENGERQDLHYDTADSDSRSQDPKRISKPPRIASCIIPTLSPLSVETDEDEGQIGRAY